jgi:cytochrome P450
MRPGLIDLAAQWIPGLPASRPRKNVPTLETAVKRIIASHQPTLPNDADLLSLLLVAVENRVISMADARDHVAHMLIAGHETTEQTLLWAWYLLSLHPSEESILQRNWIKFWREGRRESRTCPNCPIPGW